MNFLYFKNNILLNIFFFLIFSYLKTANATTAQEPFKESLEESPAFSMRPHYVIRDKQGTILEFDSLAGELAAYCLGKSRKKDLKISQIEDPIKVLEAEISAKDFDLVRAAKEKIRKLKEENEERENKTGRLQPKIILTEVLTPEENQNYQRLKLKTAKLKEFKAYRKKLLEQKDLWAHRAELGSNAPAFLQGALKLININPYCVKMEKNNEEGEVLLFYNEALLKNLYKQARVNQDKLVLEHDTSLAVLMENSSALSRGFFKFLEMLGLPYHPYTPAPPQPISPQRLQGKVEKYRTLLNTDIDVEKVESLMLQKQKK
jgi:hypothetical protein